ncbi:unnamed protein product [Clonostachys byssicola]|uniref:Glycine zipper 2TM domain-containing protein n=1 Tax=Clonostachys byssicola TaxID=160290 RepID=A0A9N9UG05_9HYPO|nr:unnamed protein product [Clonostachys byssicola]
MSNQSYYGFTNYHNAPRQPQNVQRHAFPSNQHANMQGRHETATVPDGERGLGATIVGGGAGGWAARKAGKGVLGSLASAAAGAVGANLLEKQLKKIRNKKQRK